MSGVDITTFSASENGNERGLYYHVMRKRVFFSILADTFGNVENSRTEQRIEIIKMYSK